MSDYINLKDEEVGDNKIKDINEQEDEEEEEEKEEVEQVEEAEEVEEENIKENDTVDSSVISGNINNNDDDNKLLLKPIVRKPYKVEKKKTIKDHISKYLKSIIYGGMDGLVSIFVSIAVSYSSSDSKISVLLIIVLSKLVAGAVSMGVGDYLGTQADIDFAIGERRREAWEVEYYLDGEKKEMIEIYTNKGIPEEVAKEVVEILSLNPKGFVDVMMVEELGIMPDTESQSAWKNGLVNFVSFTFFGTLPLLPYLVFLIVAYATKIPSEEHLYLFLTVIGITCLTLFLIGIFKAKSTQTAWYKSGISTVVFGIIGAAAGLGTVELIKVIFPDVDISQ